MDPLIISMTVLGAILSFLMLFIFIRNLEAAIFWAVLLGPAIGNSIAGFIINLVSGKSTEAFMSLRFLPFFLSSIDIAFFEAEANETMVVIGGVLVFLWLYVMCHFAAKKFGLWGLPVILPLIFVAGLGFPNLMVRLASSLPIIGFLATVGSGIPLLIMFESLIIAITVLIYRFRRPKEVTLPFPKRLLGEKEEKPTWY